MAFEFNGTNQWLRTSASPITATPITLFARARSSSNSAAQHAVALGLNSSINGKYTTVSFWGPATGDPVRAYVTDVGLAAIFAETSSGYSLNTWYALAGAFVSNVRRYAVLDGTAGSDNTTTSDVYTPDRLSIGADARLSSNPGAFLAGMAAEVAVWSADLNADEHNSLAKGFKPYRVRPQSLVFYAPLIRNLQDVKGALALTNNNAATVTDHPRVY